MNICVDTRPRTKRGQHRKTKLPMFFEKLTRDDQDEYQLLRERLSSPEIKSRRSKTGFETLINMVKEYSVRGDEEDAIRSFVCGIVWLDNGLAINTHQLSLIISKCKSSINGSLQALGYGTVPSGADSCQDLLELYPFMRNKFAMLRQWTIRQKVDAERASNLLAIVQKCCQEESAGTEDFISPPPDLSRSRLPLTTGAYVTHECSLGETFHVLSNDHEEPDDDPFCFLPDESLW